VSVCVPVYNAGQLLQASIASVLEQKFSDFELIVVDDGSEENPGQTIHRLDDSRIRYYENETNIGLPANWNRCIEYSRGQYITIFHQDDLMLPGNLAAKCAFLDSNSAVGMVYSDIITIDENGETIGGHYIEQPRQDRVMAGTELFSMVGETGNPVACPTVMVRSACYERLGTFDTSLVFATDLEMWLRIAAHYDLGYLSQPLVAHRLHSRQEGARFRSSGKDYVEVLEALDRTFESDIPEECLDFRSSCYKTLSRQAIPMARWKLREGRLGVAMRYSMVAIMAQIKSWIR
jgi:glycosyltransferase involved in cell wall biosynthesis